MFSNTLSYFLIILLVKSQVKYVSFMVISVLYFCLKKYFYLISTHSKIIERKTFCFSWSLFHKLSRHFGNKGKVVKYQFTLHNLKWKTHFMCISVLKQYRNIFHQIRENINITKRYVRYVLCKARMCAM